MTNISSSEIQNLQNILGFRVLGFGFSGSVFWVLRVRVLKVSVLGSEGQALILPLVPIFSAGFDHGPLLFQSDFDLLNERGPVFDLHSSESE